MIDQHFSPADAEPSLYKKWEASGAFKPIADDSKGTFSIAMPPPNVTGSLHIGHALNHTLQDILTRHARMQGKATLWQPGLDHAGIATQMVVERQLAETQQPGRRAMGREAFVSKVWEWKAESGGMINNQLRRLGASCDWSRERFTMDDGLSDAVRKVFVALHEQGLIYRDKRLVNWDPHFETAVSNLEVENEERQGHFWHFKYPLENGETYEFPIGFDDDGNPIDWETRDYIAIATTRPETMLGDGAVAVHPSDTRYAGIVGKMVRLPLADRLIPIIADEYPDPDFGSGAVKITGAHDFNDYAVAKRHGLPMLVLMDTKARMADVDHVPAKYRGMDRFEARKAIVADIDALGLLERVEDKLIMQPMGDRSGVVIEPMLTDQWYVDAATMSKKAVAAVNSGETRFIPETWTKTFHNWMDGIEPWCISRQLWWGHRIPVWYGPVREGDMIHYRFGTDEASNSTNHDVMQFVAETPEAAISQAQEYYGTRNIAIAADRAAYMASTVANGVCIFQDEDVLDTWFSSGLWPFTTLGWPQQTPELARFYPTSTLVTSFDIIFFWVARMLMMGTEFTGQAPFANVVIHARVVDEKGKKMSKSKGNVIDPLVLIDQFGADALRFSMAIAAGPGRDIRMSDKRVEGYRNFRTKLWNAARYCQMNECSNWEAFDPASVKGVVNRWIVSQTTVAASAVDNALAEHRFDEAAQTLYSFIWNVFCDWYVELIKPVLSGADESAKAETRHTAAWTLDQILKILHPFMPFITEELWDKLAEFGPKRANMLIVEPWPALPDSLVDQAAADEIQWLIDLVSGIRSLKAEANVPGSAKITALLVNADLETRTRLERYQNEIDRLARLEFSNTADEVPKGSLTFVLNGATVALPMEGIIDIGAEKARLAKEIARCAKDIAGTQGKLSNPNFMERAKPEVIEENQERLASLIVEKAALEGALSRLGE